MQAQVVVEEDWTEVVDQLDKFRGVTKPGKLSQVLNQLHRPDTSSQQQESSHQFTLVVQIVPTRANKELAAYTNPDEMLQVSKKLSFDLPEAIFAKLDIDESKCMNFCKDSNQIKIAISYKQPLATCEYDKHIQHLLEHVAGARTDLRFTSKNQFDFVYLCELFKMGELKQHILSYMSHNVDKNQVFEFLRVASLDPNNQEARREAYWIIVSIYLQKVLGIDISESFRVQANSSGATTGGKVRQMLQDIDHSLYSFNQGFLECNGKKIELTSFEQVADEENNRKEKFLEENNLHNLTNVTRSKSDMGVFSDYPHFYEIAAEGKTEPICYATRASENSEFVLTSSKDVHCKYGPNFLGVIKPNFTGTVFDLYDWGFEQKEMKDLPKNFVPAKRRLQTIEYDSNFFAERPRSFRITIYDYKAKTTAQKEKVKFQLENLPPKFNQSRGCYTLNFFGRVNKASARNFQLVMSRDEDSGDEPNEDFMLSHGKCSKNLFNLDYRAPLTPLLSFAVSLSAIGKKRIVG